MGRGAPFKLVTKSAAELFKKKKIRAVVFDGTG
jgi:hypothetical protein